MVWTDYQLKGRGQGSNSWESEAGRNLTFSILVHPHDIKAHDQYVISMAVAVTMHRFLSRELSREVYIKWPNDIYVGDFKIAGILIENRLKGGILSECVVGIGLNVNQMRFRSNAPNPVSIRQITGAEVEVDRLQRRIMRILVSMISNRQYLLTPWLKREYMSCLYRRVGYHRYADCDGEFEARMMDVEPSGRVVLKDRQRRIRTYAFKEVRTII